MKHCLLIWGNTEVLGVKKSSFRKVGALNPLSRAIIHELCSDHGLLSGADLLCRIVFVLVTDSLFNSVNTPLRFVCGREKFCRKGASQS